MNLILLNEEVEKFISRWSKTVVNLRSPSHLREKIFMNILYEG